MKVQRCVLLASYAAGSTQQQLPSCARTCLNRTTTPCEANDTLCRCSSPEFVSAVSCCIVINCGPIDQEVAGARLSSQCLSVGVAVASTASCASPSRTSTSVSTTLSLTTQPTSSQSLIPSFSAVSGPTGISSTAIPTATPSATPPPSPPSSSGLSAGAIAGTAVSSLIGIAILVLALVLFRTRRPAAQGKQGDGDLSSNTPEFGDTILESNLVQTAQHLVVAAPVPPPGPAHVHPPVLAELPSPSEPLKQRVYESPYPPVTSAVPSSVPTTAVSELPSEHGKLDESSFDPGAPSLISPVSPSSDARN